MMPFPQVDLSAGQAEAMVRALYLLSAVDGVAPEELRLLQAFHDVEGTPAPISADELADALPAGPLRTIFLQTALLVAHADGSVSDAERGLLRSFAAALGVAELELLSLEYQLLQQRAAAIA
jgi:tellurite resistance protein